MAQVWASSIRKHISLWVKRLTHRDDKCFESTKKMIKEAEHKLKIAEERNHDGEMLALCASLSRELDDLHWLEESY